MRAKDAHRGDGDVGQEHKVDDDGDGDGGDDDDDQEHKFDDDDDDDDATDTESGRWAIRGKRCTILCKLLT